MTWVYKNKPGFVTKKKIRNFATTQQKKAKKKKQFHPPPPLLPKMQSPHPLTPAEQKRAECFRACLVLAQAGDALGFRNGRWEFEYDGPKIHDEAKRLFNGTIGNFSIAGDPSQSWSPSDDTVMIVAVCRALLGALALPPVTIPGMIQRLRDQYVETFPLQAERAPGITCATNIQQLAASDVPQIPFNPKGGGRGGAMRAMPIGLMYWRPEDLKELIAVSIESGRLTHNCPIGYLGALASALFTSFAIQGVDPLQWGNLLLRVEPLAWEYIVQTGRDVDENRQQWPAFWDKWKGYLTLRGIGPNQSGQPQFPIGYLEDPAMRDAFYHSLSISHWGGSAGHDSVIIAYDGILGSGGDWEKLCWLAMLHGGRQ